MKKLNRNNKKEVKMAKRKKSKKRLTKNKNGGWTFFAGVTFGIVGIGGLIISIQNIQTLSFNVSNGFIFILSSILIGLSFTFLKDFFK